MIDEIAADKISQAAYFQSKLTVFHNSYIFVMQGQFLFSAADKISQAAYFQCKLTFFHNS